jgi:hypothetical protein
VVGNWHTLGGRLRWAYQQQPARGRERGLRLFQRQMEEAAPGVQGTSLSAIQGYLKGNGEPSLRFIKHAARLLAVRAEWLAWGEGAPTEDEEASRRESPEGQLFRTSDAVLAALGIPTTGGEGKKRSSGPPAWAAVVRQSALILYSHRPRWEALAGGSEGDYDALASWVFENRSQLARGEDPRTPSDHDVRWKQSLEDLADALAAPLGALGVKASELDPRDITDYVQAVALALQRVTKNYLPAPTIPHEDSDET